VRAALQLAWAHRQNRGSPLDHSDLRLLVHSQHQCASAFAVLRPQIYRFHGGALLTCEFDAYWADALIRRLSLTCGTDPLPSYAPPEGVRRTPESDF
jgi:hypothetical protein